MIIFLVSKHHTNTLKAVANSDFPCEVFVHSYEWALQKRILPRATYVFTDRERMDVWQQRVLSSLFAHLQQAGPGYRALNNPSTIPDRGALLRKLYDEGLNDFNAYRAVENRRPQRYPVFIRRMSSHESPVTGLLYAPEQLEEALKQLSQAGEAESDLLIIEYCAQPVADNLFRKLASFRIGETIFFTHAVHDNQWLVKQGKLNSATTELYQEEQDMILGNTFSDYLSRVFDISRVEYGRVDFGIVNGRVQVYEINTNPYILLPSGHPNPVRRENQKISWGKYVESLTKIDSVIHRAPLAGRFEHPQLKRKWHGIEIKRP